MSGVEIGREKPSPDDMEKLFVNNDSMARIEFYLNKFNPIRVMKMERMEIRHSAILAWLLDPNESHGLDDKFLKAFLGEALKGQSGLGKPTAMDIARSDLRDAIVRPEWQNIDIFIHSERNSWAFVVENKYDSKQHAGQLAKYHDRVTGGLGRQDKSLTIRGIFLTLQGEEPEDPRFAPVTYEAICQLLPRFILQEAHLLSRDVETFLRHYLEIITEELGVSEEFAEMEALARQLYRENRKALDFIIEHGSGSDFAIATDEVFGANLDYLDPVKVDGQQFRFGDSKSRLVRFLPESWYQGFGEETYYWEGCDDWGAGYPLVSWIELRPNQEGTSGKLMIVGEVGPVADHEFRKSLIQAIEGVSTNLPDDRIKFQKSAADEGRRYSRFFKGNTLEVKDVQNPEELASGMKKLLKRFQPEFKAIGQVLSQFQSYGVEGEE